jgi:hypothetical protein
MLQIMAKKPHQDLHDLLPQNSRVTTRPYVSESTSADLTFTEFQVQSKIHDVEYLD